MATQGTTTVDFGVFPGSPEANVVITGQAGISAGSLVEAWILPVVSVDHSADEHLVDPPRLVAGDIVAGAGFTIFAFASARRAYGKWTVAWVWN